MSYAALLISLVTVVVSGVVAWLEGNLTKAQMRARGIKNGLSFLSHVGMWTDLFLITPALGIMCKYVDLWTAKTVIATLLISSAISVTCHILWSRGTTVQEHILGPNLKFTAAGIIHAFYFAGALAVIFLFYFGTPKIGKFDNLLVTALLMAHLPLADALVGYVKSGKFDAAGIISTIVKVALLGVACYIRL